MRREEVALVYQNFHTHPERRAAVSQVYTRHGLAMIDQVDAHDLSRVSWMVSKTRYIDAAFVSQFPSLRGIVLMSTEKWMVQLNDGHHVKVATVGEDRGYEVAEHALMLLLAALKRL